MKPDVIINGLKSGSYWCSVGIFRISRAAGELLAIFAFENRPELVSAVRRRRILNMSLHLPRLTVVFCYLLTCVLAASRTLVKLKASFSWSVMTNSRFRQLADVMEQKWRHQSIPWHQLSYKWSLGTFRLYLTTQKLKCFFCRFYLGWNLLQWNNFMFVWPSGWPPDDLQPKTSDCCCVRRFDARFELLSVLIKCSSSTDIFEKTFQIENLFLPQYFGVSSG